jgi:hypothetical protein
LAANPAPQREAIPAAALAPAVIAEEAQECLAADFQVRSDHAYENPSSFDEAKHRCGLPQSQQEAFLPLRSRDYVFSAI